MSSHSQISHAIGPETSHGRGNLAIIPQPGHMHLQHALLFAIFTCPIHFILLHSLYWLDWKSICSFYGLCAVRLMKKGAKSWNSFHATLSPPPLLIWLRNGRATKNCLHGPPQRMLYNIEPQFTISVIDRASRTTKKEQEPGNLVRTTL